MSGNNDGYPPDWDEISKRIKQERGNKCENCGTVPSDPSEVHCHHRDGNKHNNTDENLMVLCASCHGKIHG